MFLQHWYMAFRVPFLVSKMKASMNNAVLAYSMMTVSENEHDTSPASCY